MKGCKAAVGELGSLLLKPQGGRRSAQHGVSSPAALLLPLFASYPGQLLVSWQAELGPCLSFPSAKCMNGTKNPILNHSFRGLNDIRAISFEWLMDTEYTDLIYVRAKIFFFTRIRKATMPYIAGR